MSIGAALNSIERPPASVDAPGAAAGFTAGAADAPGRATCGRLRNSP